MTTAMAGPFSFETDAEGAAYCHVIVDEMVELFGISHEEAAGRVNRQWQGQKILGSADLVYHEEPFFWANEIYFGHDSNWWLNPPDLKPRPS